jgi:hypothetical protein
MLIGCTAPAPNPCTARATMSAGMLHANPHSTDPPRNSAMPRSITGLRPTESANFPYSGTVTAAVSR